MTDWPNPLARRALTLLRTRGKGEVLPLVWEYVNRMTGGKFHRLAEYIDADFKGEDAERRDAVLRVLCQALEDGSPDLLEAQ